MVWQLIFSGFSGFSELFFWLMVLY